MREIRDVGKSKERKRKMESREKGERNVREKAEIEHAHYSERNAS